MEETFDEGGGSKEKAKEPASQETAKDKDTGSIDDVTANGGENEANLRSGPYLLTQRYKKILELWNISSSIT